MNLGGYAASMASYAALVAVAVAAGRMKQRAHPGQGSLVDLAIGGVATHKLSRLLAKGSVTSPLRAPFTEFDEPAGAAEHVEHAREGSGFRHTVGELLTCPFCVGVWIATAYVGGLALAPRPTRTAATVLSVVALSDWLHLGYELVRKRANA